MDDDDDDDDVDDGDGDDALKVAQYLLCIINDFECIPIL